MNRNDETLTFSLLPEDLKWSHDLFQHISDLDTHV